MEMVFVFLINASVKVILLVKHVKQKSKILKLLNVIPCVLDIVQNNAPIIKMLIVIILALTIVVSNARIHNQFLLKKTHGGDP